MPKAEILLLEDDSNLNDTICDFLEDSGHSITPCYCGLEAQNILYEKKFDLLLLDVNVPNFNGFELLKWARNEGDDSPAIFITSLNSVDDLEMGFESGCDDYIRKPFELKELLIRIETLLKRSFSKDKKVLIAIDENIHYNIQSSELYIDDQPYPLGKKESQLLKIFIKHEGEVVSHEYIYSHLWSFDETPSDTSLRTYIKHLRKILGKDRIISIKRQGYRFTQNRA
ncbi:MAG: response regulator transcription factor [Campylobacterota bacterium]|nr:response regulator transcription factor [Campylobacterota bacterium]